MLPIIYLDMLFLINFLMDSIILFATSLFRQKPIKINRILFSAILGSLYSCIMFFPKVGFIYSVIFKLAFMTLALYIAFPEKNIRTFSKNLVVFLGINSLFSGLMFALIFATNFGTAVGSAVSNGEIYLNISPSALLFATILAYITAYCISYIQKQNTYNKQVSEDISIFFDSKVKTVTALCDTGCSLADPTNGSPAIIITLTTAKELVPKTFLDGMLNQDIPFEYKNRYRIFPYSTIDNKSILQGFISDKIILNGREIPHISIAISPVNIDSSSHFPALFNPKLFEYTKSKKQTERLETI